VPESKSPLEQALDLFVYAPLGLALTAREEMPKLVEKGRQRVTGQVMMAKMMGQFAVAQGQKEAEKAVKRFTSSPAPAPSAPAAAPVLGTDASPEPEVAVPRTAKSAAANGATESAAANGSANGSNGGGLPPVGDLAIPGYDSLSASQVVQRLAGLSGPELDAVARYESATRHRKTILTRISQLQ
jgi:hypothetical protein